MELQQNARAREGEVYETHEAPRRQTTRLPGERPACPYWLGRRGSGLLRALPSLEEGGEAGGGTGGGPGGWFESVDAGRPYCWQLTPRSLAPSLWALPGQEREEKEGEEEEEGGGRRGGGRVRLLDHGVFAAGPPYSRGARQVCSQLRAVRSLTLYSSLATAPYVVRTARLQIFVGPAGFSPLHAHLMVRDGL